MAAARDQAARILRTEPDTSGDEVANQASAEMADSTRAHVSDETARRPQEIPDRQTPDRPAVAKNNPPDCGRISRRGDRALRAGSH